MCVRGRECRAAPPAAQRGPPAASMEDGHTRTVQEVERFFNLDSERGLSDDQVKRNQEKYGPNGTSPAGKGRALRSGWC